MTTETRFQRIRIRLFFVIVSHNMIVLGLNISYRCCKDSKNIRNHNFFIKKFVDYG